jgi:hypothetical protein
MLKYFVVTLGPNCLRADAKETQGMDNSEAARLRTQVPEANFRAQVPSQIGFRVNIAYSVLSELASQEAHQQPERVGLSGKRACCTNRGMSLLIWRGLSSEV